MAVKISVVIPTYWTSNEPPIQRKVPDAVYDHPTPLESRSTLPRLLDSLKDADLLRESATISVIAAVTHRELEAEAEERTEKILSGYEDCFDIQLFSASTLRKICAEDTNLSGLLDFYGYSDVRNIGLVTAQILKSDILVFLDDDVIIKNKRYFLAASEHAGKTICGKLLGGVAGYYTDKHGDYHLHLSPKTWWKICWPKERKMNEAFRIIESQQRLTETTFAFGGNMVLHWRMFERVPFDPCIARGEDMDLLVNAKIFGFEFMLDTELRVVHLPGEGRELWSEMRQDLYRFLYMRRKILSQYYAGTMERISRDSLDPYPGHFLHFGTRFKFAVSSFLNALHSFSRKDFESLREFVRNFGEIPSALRFAAEHSLDYFEFQRRWSSYLPRVRGSRSLTDVLRS